MKEPIRFTVASNRTSVPVIDDAQMIYVLAELVPEVKHTSKRLPINFCLVLDRSGSMMGDKLRTMKLAVKNVIAQLESDDILAIVTFESRSEVLFSSQPIGDKKQLNKLVDSIQDGGGTNVAGALRTGLHQVSEHSRENEVRRIIFLSDGEATDRQQDSFDLANEAGRLGIPILCLGFGEDWNDDFMLEIADRSIQAMPGSHTGMADYIPSPEDAVRIFQDAFRSMQIVAQDAVISLKTSSDVEVRRIWRAAPHIQELENLAFDGRVIFLPVGQLEDSGAAFLAEILVPSRSEGVVRIMQMGVSYQNPDQTTVNQAVDLVIEYTNCLKAEPDINGHVMSVVEKIQAYRLQSQALDDAEAGELGIATRKLRQAVTILLAQGEDQLAREISLEADQLENSGSISSKGKKTILLTSRKTIRLSE